MKENSSPSEPGPVTERSPTRPWPTGRTPVVMVLAVTATLAVMTANIWLTGRLVRQQRDVSREHDFWVLCQPGSAPTERENAFRHLVAEGNKEWRSADLRRLNLAGLSVPGADLQNAGFHGANLAGANLQGARLCRSVLELADLTDADLGQADLKEARFLRAILKGARLREAKMRGCSIEQVQAENADLAVADLSDADCLMANLSGARLIGANLSGAKLESAVLKGANVSLARFDGANLTDTDFTNANWWRARGLTTEQLSLLKTKFAPTAAAPQALKDDYAQWAADHGPR